MTDKEYTTGGEYPGPLALTTCTGCGAMRGTSGSGDAPPTCANCGKPWAEADVQPQPTAGATVLLTLRRMNLEGNGKPVRTNDIAQRAGMSMWAAWYQLKQLEEAGKVCRPVGAKSGWLPRGADPVAPPRIAPDEVTITRGLLRELIAAVDVPDVLRPGYVEDLLARAAAALAAASGDDGGTP